MRKLAINILSVATTIGIFHAAPRGCLRSFLMDCIGEPAHDFFGEDSAQDRLTVDNDVVPYRDPFLLMRKVYPYTFAMMLDFSDRFATHRHHPVARTPCRQTGSSL